MALINSQFPPDSEFSFLNYLTGVARSILGTGNGKFRMQNNNWVRTDQKTVLIDWNYQSLMTVAMNVPHLNVVISRHADIFSSMEIKHLDKNGEEIENSEIIKLLNHPNVLQSRSEFFYEMDVLDCVYQNNFVRALRGSRLVPVPKALWALPSGQMKVQLTGNIYDQTELSGIIEKYTLIRGKGQVDYTPDEILLIKSGMTLNGVTGIDKIETIQIPLSNIVASLKSENIIITERGLIGFISADASAGDDSGSLGFDNVERERAEKDYQRRRSLDGSQGHVTFTSANVKWVPMTFDSAQLQLKETNEDSFGILCGYYGMDRKIFPLSVASKSGLASSIDQQQALVSTIQNTMQPKATKWMDAFARYLGLTERGEKLVASYDHLPCMQEDKLKKQQADKTEVEKLSQQYKDGVITKEQYCEELGIDFIEDPNEAKNASQANLRGLVGSVTGIIQINQFVAQGFIDAEAGKNIIMSIYGYDDTTAASMITSKQVDPNKPAPSTSMPTN